MVGGVIPGLVGSIRKQAEQDSKQHSSASAPAASFLSLDDTQ